MNKTVIRKSIEYSSLVLIFLFSSLAMRYVNYLTLLLSLALAASALYALFFVWEKGSAFPRVFKGAILFAAALFAVIFLISKRYLFYYLAEISFFAFLICALVFSFLSVIRIGSKKRAIGIACLGVFAAAVLFIGGFASVSHLAYHRSVGSLLKEMRLRSNKMSDEEVAAYWQSVLAAGEREPSFDLSKTDAEVREYRLNDLKYYCINENSDYENVFFFIHGGYYAFDAGSSHFAFVNEVATQSRTMVVFPSYALTPSYTVSDSFNDMLSLFRKIREENQGKKIVLSGDSAGGGYALAVAEKLSDAQPDELILLSPWVDTSMSNPDLLSYEDRDPSLTMAMSLVTGAAWRGDLSPTDPLVSPLYGDVSDLKNVTIFVGTRELFYPDIVLLYDKLTERCVPNVKWIEGENQNHVYPLDATIEGKEAVAKILEIIKRRA